MSMYYSHEYELVLKLIRDWAMNISQASPLPPAKKL